MATSRWAIFLNGNPISMETWPTRDEAEEGMIQHYLKVGPQKGILDVRELAAEIKVEFGQPKP